MISLTNLKREKFVTSKIIEQIDYVATPEVPEIELQVFEGKPFKYLPSEVLLKLVVEISRKFRNLGFINDFQVLDHKIITGSLIIKFDLKGKKNALGGYDSKLTNEISRIEMNDKFKKDNYCSLDRDAKVFSFRLPNGSWQHIALHTERSTSENLFLLFKVFYDHWMEFNDKTLTKESIISKLQKLGWKDVDDYRIRKYINNLRDYKIKPAKLDNYIKVFADRKGKGYKMTITYPN